MHLSRRDICRLQVGDRSGIQVLANCFLDEFFDSSVSLLGEP
jgi:hypothetical protein